MEPQQTTKTAAAPAARKTSEPSPAPPAANGEIPRDAISKLAFQKWQKRGCPTGEDQIDWFEAERELKASHAGKSRRG
jgi:hypothetical protein